VLTPLGLSPLDLKKLLVSLRRFLFVEFAHQMLRRVRATVLQSGERTPWPVGMTRLGQTG
jgi:hypothetical protein